MSKELILKDTPELCELFGVTPEQFRAVAEYVMSKLPGTRKQAFDPKDKIKFLDNVYMTDVQYEEVKKYYEAHGLGYSLFQEAIRELDNWFENNPGMRAKRTNDAKALKGWPLRNAMDQQAKILRLEQAQAYAKERK